MPTLNYGTTTIDYILHKEQPADLKITITLVSGIEVYAPASLSDADINRHLHKKAPWIQQKINSLNQVENNHTPYEFISGEKLPYLGRYYQLKIYRKPVTRCTLRFYQGRFTAEVPEDLPQEKVSHALEQQLIAWYRKQAARRLHKRATYYRSLMNTSPNSIQIRTQHKRWGTCTPTGDIYINWRLVMAPASVFDYVIVHKLAHLNIQDHSQAFWKMIQSILPNYVKQKEWLRVNGMKLLNIGS